MKKKVLYINTFEPPYRVDFYNLLGERYDVTMLFSETPSDRTERNAAWFTSRERTYKCVQMKTQKLRGKNIAFEVRKWLKKRDYDVVFLDSYGDLANMYAIFCLKTLKIPYVFSVDGMLPRANESKFVYKVKKYLLNGPSFVLSPSKSVDECLVHYGTDRDKIRRYHFTSLAQKDIEDAAIISQKEKSALKKKLGMEEEKTVLSVGRFTYENGYGKGYDALLRASERLGPDVGIYIVGDEPTQEFIDWKRERKLDQVHYIGFKSKEELKEYYRAADLFVLMTKEDVWGLVINEAMSYGLPIVTTDKCVAGIELVRNGVNGYIVPVGDDQKAAEVIRNILKDEKTIEKFSQNSRKAILDYTAEQMAEDVSRCFEELIQQTKKQSS